MDQGSHCQAHGPAGLQQLRWEQRRRGPEDLPSINLTKLSSMKLRVFGICPALSSWQNLPKVFLYSDDSPKNLEINRLAAIHTHCEAHYSPPIAPSSTSPAYGLCSGDVFETRSNQTGNCADEDAPKPTKVEDVHCSRLVGIRMTRQNDRSYLMAVYLEVTFGVLRQTALSRPYAFQPA